MWTTAKVHLLPGNFKLDGPLPGFLSQAGWAYNQLIRFLEVFLGISDEEVKAPLATEKEFLTVIPVRSRLVFADS